MEAQAWGGAARAPRRGRRWALLGRWALLSPPLLGLAGFHAAAAWACPLAGRGRAASVSAVLAVQGCARWVRPWAAACRHGGPPQGTLRAQLARTRASAAGDEGPGAGGDEDGGRGEGAGEGVGAEAAELRFARERLARQFAEGASGRATGQTGGRGPDGEDPFWAKPEWELGTGGLPRAGTVLLAHPDAVLRGLGGEADGELPASLLRTGFRPPPPDAERRERANLPVVLLTRRSAQGSEGLLLGVWTGSLLGDPELNFPVFTTRPLYLGGSPAQDEERNFRISMLHAYPELRNSLRLTPDGLALTLDFGAACDCISDEGQGSPMRFKFFYCRVVWPASEQEELAPSAGVWLPARCSRDLILREPDSAFEEPLWVQIAQKAGGEMADVARRYSLFAN